jgi:hypothetical protein
MIRSCECRCVAPSRRAHIAQLGQPGLPAFFDRHLSNVRCSYTPRVRPAASNSRLSHSITSRPITALRFYLTQVCNPRRRYVPYDLVVCPLSLSFSRMQRRDCARLSHGSSSSPLFCSLLLPGRTSASSTSRSSATCALSRDLNLFLSPTST